MVSALYDSKRTAFDEDLILVERVQSGDQEAFQALYRRYYDKVYAISRGIVLDSDEASDAVQEVFTLVYRNIDRFDRRSKFSTWLFRIAVNRSIQQSRKVKFKSRWAPLSEAADRAQDVESSDTSDPRVEECMAKLSPGDRAVLTLFYWDELSLQEVADALSCSLTAAKTRLFRARERFRQHFEEGM